MGKKNWRSNLDNVIEENLNELIKETKEYDYAIKKSKDKSKAQVWVALAIINSKLNKNLLNSKSNSYENKLTKEELDKILKTLETL